jgi:hypothetical protein
MIVRKKMRLGKSLRQMRLKHASDASRLNAGASKHTNGIEAAIGPGIRNLQIVARKKAKTRTSPVYNLAGNVGRFTLDIAVTIYSSALVEPERVTASRIDRATEVCVDIAADVSGVFGTHCSGQVISDTTISSFSAIAHS